MEQISSQRLIVFFYSPEIGQVKTRLAQVIGDEMALRTYKAMIANLLENLSEYRNNLIGYINRLESAEDLFSDSCLEIKRPGGVKGGVKDTVLRKQEGRTLGDKMISAFQDSFREGFEEVLLIGSDIPQIDNRLVRHFFDRLKDFPIVLGPCSDGGYYLVGFRKESFCEGLFENIQWSTEKVMSQSLENAEKCRLDFYLGPLLQDIDTYDDLMCVLEKSHPEKLQIFRKFARENLDIK